MTTNHTQTQTQTSRSFVEATSRRLAQQYADCFVLILELQTQQEFGEAGALRNRIKALLAKAKKQARADGVRKEDIDWAAFALVTFIEETIRTSAWSQKKAWADQPWTDNPQVLLVELDLFFQPDAGVAFFERLEELRRHPPARADALEVFYLCMALGYKGSYAGRSEALKELIEDTYFDLSGVHGRNPKQLSPHPKAKDKFGPKVKEIRLWIIVLIVFLLGLTFYAFLSTRMDSAAKDTRDNIEMLLRSP